MSKAIVECGEVSGKTLKRIIFYADPEDGMELVAEFDDGTALSYSVFTTLTGKATVYRTGLDEPIIVKEYPLQTITP